MTITATHLERWQATGLLPATLTVRSGLAGQQFDTREGAPARGVVCALG